MIKQKLLQNNTGFTLTEIIVVLDFKKESIPLSRTASSFHKPAVWSRN
jgi:hypothetical protein